MEVTYTGPTDPGLLDPAALSEQLTEAVRNVMPWLATLSEAQAAQPEREGKWNAKEVIGHLTDSAVNNLARFVRLATRPHDLHSYDGEAWVQIQHYSEREWQHILRLWFVLNEHIAGVILRLDKASLANSGSIDGIPVTLGFVIEDYIAHMHHHLNALRRWLPAA